MVFGWALVVIGALGVLWPGTFVTVAPHYRGVMPREISRTTVRSALVGGLLVAVTGLVVVLAARPGSAP